MITYTGKFALRAAAKETRKRMILISELDELKPTSKYIILLNSSSSSERQPHQSISIILYGIHHQNQTHEDQENGKPKEDQIEWLAIQEECPHLGQSLVHAEIQIEDSNLIAICPWHHYDFDLRTGESSTGLKACVIKAFVKEIEGVKYLFLDRFGDQEEEWNLVSITPISQRFAIEEPDDTELKEGSSKDWPSCLIGWASLILKTPDPMEKVQYTRHSINLFKSDSMVLSKLENQVRPPIQPARESSLVKVGDGLKVLKNGKSGNEKNRIRLLHSLANIELWAIDLTWDLICRFANEKIGGKSLPREFFLDFCKVAEDEAKHFTILREAIQRLGSDWGELPVHDGLWQSARDTSHSLISRICIIHLVHEARGLDVNPTQIKRVKAAGDLETAKVLEIIHADEITHVAAGHKWLNYICNASDPKLDPVEVFRREVKLHFMGKLKPPFNVEDRLKAGLDPSFYEDLV